MWTLDGIRKSESRLQHGHTHSIDPHVWHHKAKATSNKHDGHNRRNTCDNVGICATASRSRS